MTTAPTAEIEQLARRFPLVPRPRLAQPPLPQQLAEITALARTPLDHPDAAARIATAHNKAALIASNNGLPDLARTLCWQHHHRYTDHQPWNARTARYALEPLVNLARLHIRADRPDIAVDILEALLAATRHSGTADIDGRHIDLGPTIATAGDRTTIHRWLWTVTLTEGIRALTRGGRFDDALTHAEQHHGIGATLLDGRQTAVLAHTLRGDHRTAATLLATSRRAAPWQDTVGRLLGRFNEHYGAALDTPPDPDRHDGHDHPGGRDAGLRDSVLFLLEVRLAEVALAPDPTRVARIDELTPIAASITDAALARAVLTHPGHRHLPATLLARLTIVVEQALRLDGPTRLRNALDRALNSPAACLSDGA